MRTLVFVGLAMLGCQGDLEPMGDLSLEIASPSYGQFLGNAPLIVTGRVSDPTALVRVEGERVDVGADGSFEHTLSVLGPYRNVDVFASRATDLVRERIPVFAGENPIDSWPSAMTARITPDGFARMGQALGAAIDATNWDQQLAESIPTLDTGALYLGVTDLTHEPTEVVLRPVDGGLDV